jgi:hypothetical protein
MLNRPTLSLYLSIFIGNFYNAVSTERNKESGALHYIKPCHYETWKVKNMYILFIIETTFCPHLFLFSASIPFYHNISGIFPFIVLKHHLIYLPQ